MKSTIKIHVIAAALSFAMLPATVSLAQEPTPAAGQTISRQGQSEPTRIFAAADGTFFTASNMGTTTALSGGVTAGVDLGTLGFSANLPWAWQSTSISAGGFTASLSGAVVGNLTLNGFYDLELPGGELRLGARVALPLLNLGAMSAAEGAALGYAMSMNGLYQSQYYFNKRVTPGINATYLYANDMYIARASVFLDLGIPTDSAVGDTNFVAQVAYSGAFRIGQTIDVGARLTGVFPLSPSVDAQIAIEPFIGTDPELDIPLFARVGFVIPLDEPAGFAFDTGKYWGVNLSVGTNIDL